MSIKEKSPQHVVSTASAVLSSGGNFPEHIYSLKKGTRDFVSPGEEYIIERRGNKLAMSNGKTNGLDPRDLLPDRLMDFLEQCVFRHTAVTGVTLTQRALFLRGKPVKGEEGKWHYRWRLIDMHVMTGLNVFNRLPWNKELARATM